MTTSLINNDDFNGAAAKDLGMDPEIQSMGIGISGDLDTASMSSRLREERAKHMSVQART
jgi:hypothetical protein